MRAEVEGAQPRSRSHTPLPPNASISVTRSPRPESYVDTRPRSAPDDDDEDHQKQWAREEQQMMIQEQDRTIDTISGTLSTLAQQAGLMGQEIVEHNEFVCGHLSPCCYCLLQC
jgi:syntaxin 6